MSITIQEYTTKTPITMIGQEAGFCYGKDTSDAEKNYARGLDCLRRWHGRTFEFPDVYMVMSGYSARVMREWYTHIGGSPTRLQESTRYVGLNTDDIPTFPYVTPQSVKENPDALVIYDHAMEWLALSITKLESMGVPHEDAAMLLPLGMETRVVCKHNLRNLIDMSHQRMCSRAYWEYRTLFCDLRTALSEYSPEWQLLVKEFFVPKCEFLGRCTEEMPCKKTFR